MSARSPFITSITHLTISRDKKPHPTMSLRHCRTQIDPTWQLWPLQRFCRQDGVDSVENDVFRIAGVDRCRRRSRRHWCRRRQTFNDWRRDGAGIAARLPLLLALRDLAGQLLLAVDSHCWKILKAVNHRAKEKQQVTNVKSHWYSKVEKNTVS